MMMRLTRWGVFSENMADASLRIAGLYKNLNTIARFVTEWAVEIGFDDRAVYALQMAVDEACSNIIEHAYGGEGKGDIVLECTPKDDGLQVKIVDFGVAFEPESIAAPELDTPLDTRSAGGLGLFLMRQLMDDVRFEFKPGENTLYLFKRLETTV